MAKYFINGVEYANLSAARSEAKKLSKGNDTVVIKNADMTDRAFYQNGVEVDGKDVAVTAVEENASNDTTVSASVEEKSAPDGSTIAPTVSASESVSDDIKYRVFLFDKLTGTKSCLVSPPSVGGYFNSEEEATRSAQNFIAVTRLEKRFSFSVTPEKRK